MAENFTNGAQTTLNGAINGSDTTLTLTSASGWPEAPFRAALGPNASTVTEIIYVGARSGTSCSQIVRAVEPVADGTQTGQSHSSGAYITHVLTSKGLEEAVSNQVGRKTSYFADDMAWNSSNEIHEGHCIYSVNGAGAGITTGYTLDSSHFGIVAFSTGTTSSGRVTLGQAVETLALGGGTVRCGIVAQIPTLSDGSNRFTIRMGFSETFAGSPTDGVQFRYVDNANSARWLAVATSNGGESTADTGITVDTNWHTYEIEIDSTAANAYFVIDGVRVATINSGIPTGGTRATGCQPMNIIKSVGGTARLVYLDAYWYKIDFTTQR